MHAAMVRIRTTISLVILGIIGGMPSCHEQSAEGTQPPLDLKVSAEAPLAIADAECTQVERDRMMRIEAPMRISNYYNS